MQIVHVNPQRNLDNMVQIPHRWKHKILEGTLRLFRIPIHCLKEETTRIVVLNEIQQKKKKILREHIDQFTKIIVEVGWGLEVTKN